MFVPWNLFLPHEGVLLIATGRQLKGRGETAFSPFDTFLPADVMIQPHRWFDPQLLWNVLVTGGCVCVLLLMHMARSVCTRSERKGVQGELQHFHFQCSLLVAR